MTKLTRRVFATSAAAAAVSAGLGLKLSMAQAGYPARPVTDSGAVGCRRGDRCGHAHDRIAA